jgi:hypothetical protein
MLPSLTVVVVSSKDILVFDTLCVNFIDGWILLACLKNSSSSLFSKASEINRDDLLEYKEKKINKRVPLVLTYHPSLGKISGAWLNGILLKQCVGWLLLGERY